MAPVAVGMAGLLVLASLVGLNGSVRAEEKNRAKVEKAEGPEVTRLTLHPAPEPRPALKYTLLPARPDLKSGNAAVIYTAAFEMLPTLTKEQRDEQRDEIDLFMPLSKLSKEKLASWGYSDDFGRQIVRAGHQAYCDWQLSADEGLNGMIPALGMSRRTANLIGLEARLLISEGRFEEALVMLQAGMALGRHVGQDLTLIQGLVGIATHALMIGQLDEWVQRPGSPNLYWALTSLPRPSIDLAPAAQWEGQWVERSSFPEYTLRRIRTQVLARDEARELLATLAARVLKATEPKARIDIDQFKEVPPWVRERLVQYGHDAKMVKEMPAEQAHLLYTLDRLRELVEERVKWYATPYSAGVARLGAAEKNLSEASETNAILKALRVDDLDRMGRASMLAARPDRQIARARVIEAIRMYAADHGGKLPGTLADITAVPIPGDPVTGKPFVYELKDQTALLTPAALPTTDTIDNWRYELTMAK